MQFSTLVFSLIAAATSTLAVTAGYDTTYDTASLSTMNLACSDGVNGLSTRGYPTLGSIPNFPNVGAVETIPQWNSPNCGKCYAVTYNGVTVNIVGVDHAASGFVLSKAALDTLTGGHAVEFGRVEVTYNEVASSVCNM